MADTKSYKARVKPKSVPDSAYLDCDSRFATKDEGEAFAEDLRTQLGDDFDVDCISCDDEVNAEYADGKLTLKGKGKTRTSKGR